MKPQEIFRGHLLCIKFREIVAQVCSAPDGCVIGAETWPKECTGHLLTCKPNRCLSNFIKQFIRGFQIIGVSSNCVSRSIKFKPPQRYDLSLECVCLICTTCRIHLKWISIIRAGLNQSRALICKCGRDLLIVLIMCLMLTALINNFRD
jgi:hypothetical protein